MAHTGHDFPLAFRRDFNMQYTNNQLAYKEKYHVRWLNFLGTLGSLINVTYHPLGNVVYGTGIEMTWESAAITFGGSQAIFRLKMIGLDAQSRNRHVSEIELVGSGIVWRSRPDIQSGAIGRQLIVVSCNAPEINTPGVCESGFQSGCNFRGTRWDGTAP